MNREFFFPTPIYYFDLEDADALNLFLKNRINVWRESDQAGIERSNAKRSGAWHSPTNMADKPEYQAFVSILLERVQQVFENLQYSATSQPHCLNMWANVTGPGGYNRSHTHPGSLWSGVYYVQAPKDCGRIVFEDPRPQANVLSPFLNEEAQRAEHWSTVHYDALEGRLILFPSWLQHSVEPNFSELKNPACQRISISFNLGQSVAV